MEIDLKLRPSLKVEQNLNKDHTLRHTFLPKDILCLWSVQLFSISHS